MRAQFVRGKDPKDTLKIGVETILWSFDQEGDTPEGVIYLYDSMNQFDLEFFSMLEYFIDLGDKIKEGEDKILYRTELGLILEHKNDYGEVYFCHISSLPEIEKRLGRKIITE